jgi:hypothetical protein
MEWICVGKHIGEVENELDYMQPKGSECEGERGYYDEFAGFCFLRMVADSAIYYIKA